MSLLLLIGRGTEAPVETTTPAARVRSEPVDDRLFVKFKHVDGTTSRCSPDAIDATGIPIGIKTSSAAPGGYQDCGFSLLRDPRLNWSDLNLVDDVVVYGRTRPLGRNAFEGEVANLQSEFGDGYSIGVNAIGHQVLLSDDETFRALYVKLGGDGWEEASLARKEALASGGFSTAKIPGSASGAGLVWDLPAGDELVANEISELTARVPAGVKVAKVGYRGTRRGSWEALEAPVLLASETAEIAEPLDVVPLTLDNTNRVAALPTPRAFLTLRAWVQKVVKPGVGVQQSYDRIARYGDHGLTLREVPGSLPGVYAHDALAHALATQPELNFKVGGGGSIVPNTNFVIPDLSFLDPVTLKAVIEKINAYFLNNWGVWDDKTFFWQPWDPTRLTWRANVAGGARWSPAARQADTLINGIAVSYTDSAGVARLAGPPGSGFDYESPLLQDPNPNNPYTRRGRKRWGVLSVDFPIAYPTTAFQIGGVFVIEARTPQRSGTLIVQPKGRGHIPEIQHPTMGPMPLWVPRGGDYAELDGWPESEPFRMITAEYDEATKTLTAQLETGAARLSGILERVGVRLVGVISG